MAEGGEKGAEYILVSLPTNGPDQGSARATWAELAAKTERENELSTNYHFVVPDLRVGTLDSLLTLSDELSKSCLLAESTVGKIKRQLEDLGYDVRLLLFFLLPIRQHFSVTIEIATLLLLSPSSL